MDLEITGQSIKIIFCDDLVSGSVGEYTANFKFDDSWDGYELIAVFEGFTVYQRESREMNIVNGSCIVPWETLLPNGYLQVGVYGIKDGLRRPTIYTDMQLVRRGTEGAKIGTEYTPGVVEQFVAQTAENRKAAEEAATRAENAAIHQPYPNSETGTWWVWDAGTGQYEDTGESYETTIETADLTDALAALAECGIITPAYQDGTFYTDTDGAIYVL